MPIFTETFDPHSFKFPLLCLFLVSIVLYYFAMMYYYDVAKCKMQSRALNPSLRDL